MEPYNILFLQNCTLCKNSRELAMKFHCKFKGKNNFSYDVYVAVGMETYRVNIYDGEQTVASYSIKHSDYLYKSIRSRIKTHEQ